MIGLDTNILARYLTQDDPAQSRRANAVIAEATRRGDRCAVNTLVLCELVGVLRDAYGVDRDTVVTTLEKILDTAQFVIEDRDLARRALADYRHDSARRARKRPPRARPSLAGRNRRHARAPGESLPLRGAFKLRSRQRLFPCYHSPATVDLSLTQPR